MESRALFDTITIFNLTREYLLGKTVSIMCDVFESVEFKCVMWIDGKNNLSDAMTKVNLDMSIRLMNVIVSGMYDVILYSKWRR